MYLYIFYIYIHTLYYTSNKENQFQAKPVGFHKKVLKSVTRIYWYIVPTNEVNSTVHLSKPENQEFGEGFPLIP